ncbi:MAG TPA: secondary thiamine-phosphate synthase enzyme YjbQ [Ignavibacteriaceae bacterium]|nr:secondary thiamine-phosphate synthase enzyme YjbQ [Ignavibacteriaceae bacterium]
MVWYQKEISIASRKRGFHVITGEILNNCSEIKNISSGVLHLFLQHTSASLTINENVSPDVRRDLETHFNRTVPENASYEHDLEGADDMPAHIKASILGASLTIPITEGNLNLGTWQGIYLCEHRSSGGTRNIVATFYGEKR